MSADSNCELITCLNGTLSVPVKSGISRYDMNGLLNDGVSTFKQGFASHEDMLVGTYDYPLSSLYTLWARGLPLAKKIIRRAKRLVRG